MNRIFEWGMVIATFLSVLSIAPRCHVHLTDLIHPKIRKITGTNCPKAYPAAPVAGSKSSQGPRRFWILTFVSE